MKTVIAGDIGGTKTLLQIVKLEPQSKIYDIIFEKRYACQSYHTFEAILTDFINIVIQKFALKPASINACFAIAGPISSTDNSQTAKVTNLTWQLDTQALITNYHFSDVTLINDFEAIAHGLSTLTHSDFFQLQSGKINTSAPKIILGAGTGLGVCQIIYHATGYNVIASEGGHCDFAPNNEQQIELLRYLLTRYSHLSYDRLLSGMGINNIFYFLVEQTNQHNADFVKLVNQSLDPAASISNAFKNDPLAEETIKIFLSLYGAQAGNLALTSLAYGGVYLAGGIAPKLIEQFELPHFLNAFKHKGRMSQLMSDFPINVIMNTDVGVRGAAVVAERLSKTKTS